MATIVLIDDDPDFNLLVGELLREQSWEVVVCDEDQDALRCVQDAHPDLVILDVRMRTRQSGWQILEALRQDRQSRDIPVIVCSAATDDLQRRAGLMAEHGAVGLSKPFDIDDLLSLVRRMLEGDPPDSTTQAQCNHHAT